MFAFPGVATASTSSATQVQQATTAATTAAMNKGLATNNRIYRTGRLARVNCSPGSLPAGSTNAYRRFLTRVTDCLNRAWSTQFRKAGMSFAKPRLRIITRKVGTACGGWATGAAGWFRQNGAKTWPQNDHGRGPTQAAWMTRGYNNSSPGACNTWTASPRSTT
ncbi:hypothetical protein ACFYUK_17690 [Nonomuraea wenchangensis]